MNQPDFSRPEYYINRELSWLAFNHRVLEEAMDDTNPIMERVKFLAIVCSNLDEFFMVRVAGLKDQVKAGLIKSDAAGLTPEQQLSAIAQRVHEMVQELYDLWNKTLVNKLGEAGIQFVAFKDLNDYQREYVEAYFENTVYPVLTPMAVDQGRPFPLLLNRSLNLAVLLEPMNDPDEVRFAVVQVPSLLPRLIEIPCSSEGRRQFIFLEEIIKGHAAALFKGHKIRCINAFRITRNTDLTLDEEEAEDLLEEIEKEIQKRKWGAAVRLEIEQNPHPVIEEYLLYDLEVQPNDIYEISGPLDFTHLMKFALQPGFEHLRHEPLPPQPVAELADEVNIFDAIAKRDILLHHPYESFDPVIQFVTEASRDPRVLAIKQTLYRVSGDSPIVKALADAASRGKQVTVLVELKARFDEENNIQWAKMLEQSGAHVIYGLVGLKTHAKITLVVRQEDQGMRRYVHLGTGNYNDTTARLYTDLSLFTCHPKFGADASDLFNEVSGYSTPRDWNKIEAPPIGLRAKFLQLIRREIERTTPQNPGRIRIKLNSLTDEEMIRALYEASCAGVQIELIVRGICCLRPGIPGISENIQVKSIIDRFLEHHRIYYFYNGGDEEVYLSSADMMTRNLDRRIELLFPIEAANLKEKVIELLDAAWRDNVKARILHSDGRYTRAEIKGEPFQSQLYFHRKAKERAQASRMAWHGMGS